MIQGTTRLVFLAFFISHIPITLLVDGQAFLPREWYPQNLINVVDWYAVTFKDKLMTHPTEPWFTSLVSIEIVFQLPFFFYAVYSILKNKFGPYFRPLCIVYGASTSTTLVPILASITTDDNTKIAEKGVLLGFYLPYLIFPLWLTILAIFDEGMYVDPASKKNK